jgi:hypothetical protein
MICVGVALVSPMYAFEGGSENVALGILVIAAEVRFRPRHRRLTYGAAHIFRSRALFGSVECART